VGQPELADMLSSHQLRQLGQRITISCLLSPLTYEETRDYIRHRIALASHRAGPPFDKSSYRAIYAYSGGIPRLINIACDRALLNAFSRNSFKITSSITKEAIRELTRKKAGTSYNWLQGPAGLIVLSAIFIPVIILLLYHANGQSPETLTGRRPFPPELVTQAETRPAAPESTQVSEAAPPEKLISPQDEAPIAIQEDSLAPGQPEESDRDFVNPANSEVLVLSAGRNKTSGKPLAVYEKKNTETDSDDTAFHSVHVGTFRSPSQAEERVAELRASGYPSFLYTQESSSGNTVYVVVAGKYQSYALAKEAGRSLSKAGYSNFVARAKDSLDAGLTGAEPQAQTGIVVERPRNSGEGQNFLNFLQGLNSRFSRNNAMEEILKLWFPAAEIKIKKNKLDIDRFFFAEAAKQYDLQVEPIAGASDALVQALDLPVIFSFYLKGQAWPKYLAAAYIDKEKIYFVEGGQGQTVSVDRDIFLQYWSGEAYIFWKNFKNLPGVISQRSKGLDIKSLKKLLQQLGYSNIIMTDRYDKNTLQIIKAIQTKYGMQADGLVGPLTKIALYNESAEFTKPSLVKFDAARTENGS
jgi:cell division protein FtsN